MLKTEKRIEDSLFLHSVVIATLRDNLFSLHSISLRTKARLDFQNAKGPLSD